jgi:hypothetical protein
VPHVLRGTRRNVNDHQRQHEVAGQRRTIETGLLREWSGCRPSPGRACAAATASPAAAALTASRRRGLAWRCRRRSGGWRLRRSRLCGRRGSRSRCVPRRSGRPRRRGACRTHAARRRRTDAAAGQGCGGSAATALTSARRRQTARRGLASPAGRTAIPDAAGTRPACRRATTSGSCRDRRSARGTSLCAS